MPNEEIKKVTILVKAGNKKGFMIEGEKDQWYTAKDSAIEQLANVEKGDVVEITYKKNGTFRNVSKIEKVTVKQEVKESATGYVCEDCGKPLKDDKYKKCFLCNKKNPTPKKTEVIDEGDKGKDTGWKKSNYGSAEDVAGKEVGCAANCASRAVVGVSQDPEELLQAWRILFNGMLDHIRATK